MPARFRVMTCADADYFHFLPYLEQNIARKFGRLPIVYDLGLTPEQRTRLKSETVSIEVADAYKAAEPTHGFIMTTHKPKRVLVVGLLIQALAIPAYLAARDLGDFYLLAAIFGAAYGGVMPLYAVLAREYFGQAVMGTVLGAATMLSALGMALGPLGGGVIYDTFGNYTWLYLGSALLAFGAVAISLAFPPLPDADRRGAAA